MTPLSLRARIALLAAAAVGLSIALATVAAYVTLRHELRHEVDEALVHRARIAAASSLADPNLLLALPAAAYGATDTQVLLARPNGDVITAAGAQAKVVGRPEFQVALGLHTRSIRTVRLDDARYRVVAVPVPRGGGALVLARSLGETQQVLARVTTVLLLIGLFGIALAASAGLAVARAALWPVRRLTAAAEHVAATEELAPIEVPADGSPDDELHRLALAFNAMLAALADSRSRQRRLVADAGHELRTPLTSLRTNLDLLAQADAHHGLPAEERAQLLADVRAQVAELSDLVTDLVELAREDVSPAVVDVDLAAVVERAVARARRRASGVSIQVDLRPWQLRGDPRLLERAVTNLLDNAVKWSPPDGVVRVTLRDGVVQVADEGPGIAERDLPHVFDRFYRAEDARALPGSGLGLAIVRQVARQHGGTADAGRTPAGGALLTLRLPGRPVDRAGQPVAAPTAGSR